MQSRCTGKSPPKTGTPSERLGGDAWPKASGADDVNVDVFRLRKTAFFTIVLFHRRLRQMGKFLRVNVVCGLPQYSKVD